MIQICSEITSGRVLNGELYAQRLQKSIYRHLLTGCFMKISLQSSEHNLEYVAYNSNRVYSRRNVIGNELSLWKENSMAHGSNWYAMLVLQSRDYSSLSFL